MPRCAGTKRDGGQCTAIVKAPLTYCYQHDPTRAEERRRASSRAGKAKPSRDLISIKGKLSEMVEEVLSGSGETSRYAVAGQLLNTKLRAIELERKVRELDDLEARLEELEASLGQRRAG